MALCCCGTTCLSTNVTPRVHAPAGLGNTCEPAAGNQTLYGCCNSLRQYRRVRRSDRAWQDFRDGSGVPVDEAEAEKWYMAALAVAAEDDELEKVGEEEASLPDVLSVSPAIRTEPAFRGAKFADCRRLLGTIKWLT